MNISLDGRRALVTGGNSGIGAAIVLALAEAGASVAINYLVDPEAAQSLAGRVGERGARALALQADISDPQAVAGMFARIDEAWGGLDVLVNNAGIDGKRALAWEADPAQWRQVVEVNLFGAFYCAREALKRMVPRKAGVILNVSSVHEIIAWSGYSAYTASKAAVGMMTQTLAQEAAPLGIRVLALGPGAVKTPINKSVWSDPANMKDLLEKVPLNRIGTPEEIARIAVVLVSDVSSYITGRTIFVDGGMTDYPEFSHGG
jgi:glucose 1-dehydrogenase